MATAVPITAVHEQVVPHSGPRGLPAPWVTLATSARVTAQRIQNVTGALLEVATGTALSPLVLQPGDTLFAWADDTRRAIVRVPYCGRRFTAVRRIHAAANALAPNPIGTPDALGLTVDESDLLVVAGVLRGDCGGLNSGLVTIKHTGSDLSGLPTTASVTGIATNDAAGNIGASIAGLVTDPGTISLGVQGGASGPCDFGNVNGRFLIVCASEPLEFAPPLDAPVTVRFGESLNGVFADPTIEAGFFQMIDLPVGSRYSLGDQLSGEQWYQFDIRDRSRSRGLVNYSGETLISKLSRITPRESLILVAGEGGVPNPLDLRECLRRFLVFYGVPFVDDLPQFFLRASDEIVAPEVDAFVIQPEPENPESLYALLERFFGPFRGYTFRADVNDRLVVTQPAWVDTIGLRLTVHRRRQALDREPVRSTVRAPWSTTRAPTVHWTGQVNGVSVTGELPDPLTPSGLEVVNVSGIDVRVAWDPGFVQVMVWPTPGLDVTVGNLYSLTFVFRPEVLPGDTETLQLTNVDLGPDEVETTSADSVINQAIVPVRRRTFESAQQVMQAAAVVLRSPVQLMAGAFGNNLPFGPMSDDLDTPSGFLELVTDAVQSGTWFWPVDPLVVVQPGGQIDVAVEVEEWAEQWRDASAPHAAASQINTWSDTFTLPANGEEIELFRFEFPRQTSDFAPSPYGARGTVYGRWRAGAEPGIEVRVGNSRFVEFGYLAELFGILGQTVYFLWGAIVKLNGTGTTFTEGPLEQYRFGFSRGDDGLWEDGANVPALAESQMLYPDRVFTSPELPYEVSAATAVAIARGIVEENLVPKAIYSLPLTPSRSDGWAARPEHLGRAAFVQAPGLSLRGRVTAFEYDEAHTGMGSTSGVTVEIEVAQAPAGSRAASRAFGRSAYGVSHYHQED